MPCSEQSFNKRSSDSHCLLWGSDLIHQIYKVSLTRCQEWTHVFSCRISQPMLGSTSAHWSSYDPVVDVISGVTDGTLHWQYLGLTWFSFPSTEESLSFWDFFHPPAPHRSFLQTCHSRKEFQKLIDKQTDLAVGACSVGSLNQTDMDFQV